MAGRSNEDPAVRERLALHRLDAVELEEVRRLLDVVDDVVDRRREPVDVLAVERRPVLRCQELAQVVRDRVAGVLELPDLGLRHRRVRKLTEPDLGLLRDGERVRSRSREEAVELVGARGERELHAGRRSYKARQMFSPFSGRRLAGYPRVVSWQACPNRRLSPLPRRPRRAWTSPSRG